MEVAIVIEGIGVLLVTIINFNIAALYVLSLN